MASDRSRSSGPKPTEPDTNPGVDPVSLRPGAPATSAQTLPEGAPAVRPRQASSPGLVLPPFRSPSATTDRPRSRTSEQMLRPTAAPPVAPGPRRTGEVPLRPASSPGAPPLAPRRTGEVPLRPSNSPAASVAPVLTGPRRTSEIAVRPTPAAPVLPGRTSSQFVRAIGDVGARRASSAGGELPASPSRRAIPVPPVAEVQEGTQVTAMPLPPPAPSPKVHEWVAPKPTGQQLITAPQSLPPPIDDGADEPTGVVELANVVGAAAGKPPASAVRDEITGVVEVPPGLREPLPPPVPAAVGSSETTGEVTGVVDLSRTQPVKTSDLAAAAEAGPKTGAIILPDSPTHRLGFQIVVAAVMLVAGLGAVAGFVFGGSAPSDVELAVLYPYGKSGGRMPNGHTAPGMAEVTFRLLKKEDCTSGTCFRYQVDKDGSPIGIEMLVGRRDDAWQLVSTSAEP